MANNIVAACIACGSFLDLKADVDNLIQQRCTSCRDERALAGKFGSLIVEGALTQKDLAALKREFYQLYRFDEQLRARQAEFMRIAQEEMQKVIDQVEQAMGQPVKELRARKQQLEAQLQAYMQESKSTELVVKDLLVELQNAMVNRGNMPQYKKIIDDLRLLLKWTEEEMVEAFPVGTAVRWAGHTGYYVVRGHWGNAVSMYGGSLDPEGVRMFRSALPNDLTIDTRRGARQRDALVERHREKKRATRKPRTNDMTIKRGT